MRKINLQQALAEIHSNWDPHIAAELNGQYVKLVKFAGTFTWHSHEHEDELFLVVRGKFRLEYREPQSSKENSIWVNEGEMIVVPRGIEHRPIADGECHVLLFEPISTVNTGNVENSFTRRELSHI